MYNQIIPQVDNGRFTYYACTHAMYNVEDATYSKLGLSYEGPMVREQPRRIENL